MWFTFWPKTAEQSLRCVVPHCRGEERTTYLSRSQVSHAQYAYISDPKIVWSSVRIHDELITPLLCCQNTRSTFIVFTFIFKNEIFSETACLDSTNARPHIATVVQQFFATKGIPQLSHSPDFPDQSPPFLKLKLRVERWPYTSVEEFQKFVTAKPKAFPIDDFSRAIKKLENCLNDLLRLGGEVILNKYCSLNFLHF